MFQPFARPTKSQQRNPLHNPDHNFSLRSVYRVNPNFGHPFHWLEAGWHNPQPLIMLHGLMAHSMAYRRVAHALAARYHVIIPDLPGHGRDHSFHSSAVRPEIDSFADWFSQLLDTVQKSILLEKPDNSTNPNPPIHLVGHSLGAILSFLATARPLDNDRLTSLTLVSPGLHLDVPRWAPNIVKHLPVSLARLGTSRVGIRIYEPIQWRQARMNKNEINQYLEPIQNPQRLKFMLALAQNLLETPDRITNAHQVDLPTMIMWGTHDRMIPRSTLELIQNHVPQSQTAVFENCGHSPMEDCPKQFVRSLTDFLV